MYKPINIKNLIMTTKEKAEEITNKHLNDWIAEFVEYNNLSKNDRNQIRFKLCSACDEMAEWEHKRLIDKACDWLLQQEEMIGISFQEDFIERFKEAMEK